MKFRKKHNSSEENFWLSATDMMAGMLIVVLLMLVLFVLYLNQSVDEEFTPLKSTEATFTGNDDGPYKEKPTEVVQGESSYHYIETYYSDNGSTGETQAPTQEPTEIRFNNGNDDGHDKAAVFVTVVDDDTGNTIKKAGIEFELYAEKNGIGGLQTLYTYYPEKIEYKKYETNDRGTFYLPEKISEGWYSLHNLVAPEGYYIEGNTDFEIDEFWDWSEPYMVTVAMEPIKKTVRISAEDYDTKDAMADVTCKIVAAEDIKSADGSVRYSMGEEVDEITTDDTGFAESRELYIGKYYIKQTATPEFYAVDDKAVSTSISETADGESGLVSIECHKTSVTVSLTDERTEAPIAGAVYSMEGREELVTDANGRFTVSDLTESTAYSIKLVSLPEGYLTRTDELTFTVDSYGLVDERYSAVINYKAYNLCISVTVEDKIFKKNVTGVDLYLVDEDGNITDEWTSSDVSHVITGLSEKVYYIRRLDDEKMKMSVNVKDTPELQNVKVFIWGVIDLFALLMAIGAVVIASLIFGLIASRRRKKKRDSQNSGKH